MAYKKKKAFYGLLARLHNTFVNSAEFLTLKKKAQSDCRDKDDTDDNTHVPAVCFDPCPLR